MPAQPPRMTAVRTYGETPGQRLQALRKAKGWSQQRLRAESGVNQGTISLLEHDYNREPYVITVARLAAALGVTIPYLWLGDPGRPHEEEEAVS